MANHRAPEAGWMRGNGDRHAAGRVFNHATKGSRIRRWPIPANVQEPVCDVDGIGSGRLRQAMASSSSRTSHEQLLERRALRRQAEAKSLLTFIEGWLTTRRGDLHSALATLAHGLEQAMEVNQR